MKKSITIRLLSLLTIILGSTPSVYAAAQESDDGSLSYKIELRDRYVYEENGTTYFFMDALDGFVSFTNNGKEEVALSDDYSVCFYDYSGGKPDITSPSISFDPIGYEKGLVLAPGETVSYFFVLLNDKLDHGLTNWTQYDVCLLKSAKESEEKSVVLDYVLTKIPHVGYKTCDKLAFFPMLHPTSDGVYKIPNEAVKFYGDEINVPYTIDASEANPNCIYYIGDIIPSGLPDTEVNVAYKQQGCFFMKQLVIDSRYPFQHQQQEPDFIENASFIFTRDRNCKYETLTCPFNYEEVSFVDEEGNLVDGSLDVFIPSKISGNRLICVNSSEAPDKTAHYPNIISVRGDADKVIFKTSQMMYELNEPIWFAELEGDLYLYGTYSPVQTDCWVLDETGTALVRSKDGYVKPFSCFLYGDYSGDKLQLMGETSITGVEKVENTTQSDNCKVYDTRGIYVGKSSDKLKNGVYVIRMADGTVKKVIVR